MKVAIVGTGNVGTALAENMRRHGHTVVVGTRSPSDGPDGPSVAVERCADGAEVVILAVPFGAVGDVVPRLGLAPGQVLVDATNPFGAPLPPDAASGFDAVAGMTPEGVAVVKAFNVLGAEHMAHPQLPDGFAPILPVAGTDEAAVRRVVELARELGFDALDVGDGTSAAPAMESAAAYWGLIAFRGGRGRNHVLVSHVR